MSTIADVMHEALTVLGRYGEAKIVAGDGEVFMYSQAAGPLGSDGFFPVNKKPLTQQEINGVYAVADEANIGILYREDYYDEYSKDTFPAWVLLPVS